MKYVFIFCISLLISGFAHSQTDKTVTTTIHGTVAGFDTKRPITNATVTLSGNGITKKSVTDQKGYFSFGQLTAGSYDITYEAAGYKIQVRKKLPLANGKKVRTAVLLQRG
jgi:hypothetical protein